MSVGLGVEGISHCVTQVLGETGQSSRPTRSVPSGPKVIIRIHPIIPCCSTLGVCQCPENLHLRLLLTFLMTLVITQAATHIIHKTSGCYETTAIPEKNNLNKCSDSGERTTQDKDLFWHEKGINESESVCFFSNGQIKNGSWCSIGKSVFENSFWFKLIFYHNSTLKWQDWHLMSLFTSKISNMIAILYELKCVLHKKNLLYIYCINLSV